MVVPRPKRHHAQLMGQPSWTTFVFGYGKVQQPNTPGLDERLLAMGTLVLGLMTTPTLRTLSTPKLWPRCWA